MRGNTRWQTGFASRPKKGLYAAIYSPGILCLWRHELQQGFRQAEVCIASLANLFFFLYSAEMVTVPESSKQLLLFSPSVFAWSVG